MKKILLGCLATAMLCCILNAEDYLEIVEQAENYINQQYKEGSRAHGQAYEKLDGILNGQYSEEEKINLIKRAFPKAFQKVEEPLIFNPPVAWHIHSLSLRYDVQESVTTTTTAADTFKTNSSSRSEQESSARQNVQSQHQVNFSASAGNDFSLNPFSWLSTLFGTKIKLAGSYTYGRDSVAQTTELWSQSQQELFSRESSRISEMTHQTNINNLHLAFTVRIINNGNETIYCNLKGAYIPVYGEHGSSFNINAVPHDMPTEILEISPQGNRDIIFSVKLDNTQSRALAAYMANNSPVIDILQGGNLRITTRSGKNAIDESIKNVTTLPIKINLPNFTGFWNIRVNHTSNGNLTTLHEALTAIGDDIENACKYNLFQYDDKGNLSTISKIPLGQFGAEYKDCRYIAFLQIGNKVYDKITAEMLNAQLPDEDCTFWVIDLDNLEDYKNINPAVQKLIYEKLKTAAEDGFLGLFEKGNPAAQYRLATMCLDGIGVKQDYAEAVEWFSKAAEQGNARAQNNLGDCYYYGFGVEKDYYKAAEWYRKAVGQGHVDAQCNLGVCYYYGRGVDKDYSEAVRWYRRAAEQGDSRGQYLLGNYYYDCEKNYDNAVIWFEKSAEQGNAWAQYTLGDCYYYGRGVKQDYTEAVKWYRQSADQGNAWAQRNLGNCYYSGRGIGKDHSKAVKLYRKAAEQGDAWAQYMLGLCYRYGYGIDKDIEMAKYWYRKAAEQGNELAQMALNSLE